MDSQLFMSVTADVSVREKAVLAPPWSCFAPFMEKDYVRELIQKRLLKPQISLKSQSIDGAELRLHFEDRLGIAGLVKDGQVEVAYPFVQFGREYEMEIVNTSSGPLGMEGWVSAKCLGMELTFCDVLASLGTNHVPGDQRRFTLGALAMSIKRVAPVSFTEHLDDGELGLAAMGIRGFVAKKGECLDQGIFQSPVESEPSKVQFKDREFMALPISLAEQDGKKLIIDLVVASELLETLDSPVEVNEDIAGVLWLHGYCLKHFRSSS